MSKRLSLTLLSAILLLAGCGATPQVSSVNNTPQATTQETQLTAQAISCTAYMNKAEHTCDTLEYNAALTAGQIYKSANLAKNEYKTTVAVAKVNNQLIVAVNGTTTPSAINKIRDAAIAKGATSSTFLIATGSKHAEQAIYDQYKTRIIRIGISNYGGPCDGSIYYNCQLNVGDNGVSISWFPGYKYYNY